MKSDWIELWIKNCGKKGSMKKWPGWPSFAVSLSNALFPHTHVLSPENCKYSYRRVRILLNDFNDKVIMRKSSSEATWLIWSRTLSIFVNHWATEVRDLTLKEVMHKKTRELPTREEQLEKRLQVCGSSDVQSNFWWFLYTHKYFFPSTLRCVNVC